MNNFYGRGPGMVTPVADSPFVEAAAVDAWDAWFRWRDHGALRDLTVDATWDRVAAELASVESRGSAKIWKRRFVDVFATWRLLLDERIVASAGTTQIGWASGGLVAVLNVAAFVRASSASHAFFDQPAFEEVASLAVRALENAAELAGHAPIARGFSVGIVGLADALAQLDIDYDGGNGCALAALVGRSLAQGCHRGSSQLVFERGALAPCTETWRARARKQDVATEILAQAASEGIRHHRLTAITSQAKLALFANDVSDALDPLFDRQRPDSAAAHDGLHVSPARFRTPSSSHGLPVTCGASAGAQLELRAAIGNWIDEPIDYPLLVDAEPSLQQSAQWSALAESLGLPQQIRWRRPGYRAGL